MHNATRTPKTNASVLNYAATHDRMCKHTRAQEYQPIVAENEHHLFVIVALRRPASPHSCGAVCFVTRRCQNRNFIARSPTEQILLGNQVHLYQGNFIVQLSKFCLVIVLYQGGARTWGEVRAPTGTKR